MLGRASTQRLPKKKGEKKGWIGETMDRKRILQGALYTGDRALPTVKEAPESLVREGAARLLVRERLLQRRVERRDRFGHALGPRLPRLLGPLRRRRHRRRLVAQRQRPFNAGRRQAARQDDARALDQLQPGARRDGAPHRARVVERALVVVLLHALSHQHHNLSHVPAPRPAEALRLTHGRW
eukprot:3909469-Pleurochrysis_carterae.AAC.3